MTTEPSPCGAASATVVAADCLTANALATALCVLPIHEGLALVEAHAGTDALVISRRRHGFADQWIRVDGARDARAHAGVRVLACRL